MNAMDLIAARLAAPKKFRVVTLYECGKTYTHDTEMMGQAENWAIGERRKIGRDLIERATGKTVRVVSVEILGL
ncbi:hypothetical protein LB559_09145 [Mesorhizobium sp. BR1-1-3]|uniref:hypothetical protein n=1 Tax=Mesorhizobium sp. BR1-1-3 TaxID=2876651 RepID=UPI001CD0C1CE|nr:hypothetical protein [Mesorhizobium sp. BR1-1-3]MBZ9888104.1 hypothetical protein [Mesorhizobium sp. BR1-1-3]